MPVPEDHDFFVDPNRCIGCMSCVEACTECDTHKGRSMIHVQVVERPRSTQTVPVICMHCDSPTCAEVCPADAIKRTPDGVVQSALKARCIACSNCVLACPFGVPRVFREVELMMKCDMCYDRTSIGLGPMCATVCPSQALAYGRREDIERLRARSRPVSRFQFGNQTITTKVHMMVPRFAETTWLDVTAALTERPGGKGVELDALMAGAVEVGPDDEGGAAGEEGGR